MSGPLAHFSLAAIWFAVVISSGALIQHKEGPQTYPPGKQWAVLLETDRLYPELLPPAEFEDLADIPPALRQENYVEPGCRPVYFLGRVIQGCPGSCFHATTVTLLRWQGLYEMADWWKQTYHSGDRAGNMIEKWEAAGLRYAYSVGDVEFLEWATRNRLGVGITYKQAHVVTLVDLTPEHAIILDNNNVEFYEYIPREVFLSRWNNLYGGFAWTFVYQPSPAWPIIGDTK